MLLVALLLSLLVCAGLAVLPDYLAHRRPTRRAVWVAALTWAAVLVLNLLIYSRPGLTVSFGRHRLAAVAATALFTAGLVCGLRLCHGWRQVLPLLALAALGAELLVFNAAYYATYSYESLDLTPLLQGEGTLQIDEAHTTLQTADLNTEVYNLQLDGLQYTGPQQDPRVQINVYVADNNSSTERLLGSWQLAAKAPRSHNIKIGTAGPVRSLTLEFVPLDGETLGEDAYTLTGVTANAPQPLRFSWLRFIVVTLAAWVVWALRPGSGAWQRPYLRPGRCGMAAKALCAVVLAAGCVVLPTLNMRGYGQPVAEMLVQSVTGQNPGDFSHTQYGALAHSLLNGRLDFEDDPDPKLLEMENPYDYYARQEQGVACYWDTVYYNGRYYTYFGIVPCLLLYLPYEALTGVQNFPNKAATIIMALVLLLALFGTVKQLIRRLFPKLPLAAGLLLAVGVAAGSEFYNLATCGDTYHLAIISGTAFLLLGFWQWLLAANTPVQPGKTKPGLVLHLGLGSLFVALVAGCRPQMVLFAVLCLPLFWQRYATQKRLFSRGGAAEAVAFALPVVLVAAGLCWYNAARFGSPFEFGASYNLTANDMTQRGFDAGRIAPSFFAFLLDLPQLQAVFPYLTYHHLTLSSVANTIEEEYIGGVLACIPFLWGLFAWPRLHRRRQLGGAVHAALALCVAVAAVVLLADCQMSGIVFRYTMDVTPALLLAAGVCWCTGLQNARGAAVLRWRRAMAITGVLCLVYRFLAVFTAQPWLNSSSPAVFYTVSRLVQFWM